MLMVSWSSDLSGSSPTPRTIPTSDTDILPPSTSGTSLQPAATASTAGLHHTVEINNSYYRAKIPVWLDEPFGPNEWKADFLSEEAGEVVRAVGAWIVVFRLNWTLDSRSHVLDTMAAVKEVISHAYGGDETAWDGICLAVGWPSGIVGKSGGDDAALSTMVEEVRDWDDECLEHGFEFVDGRRGSEKNSHGELGGVARVREALEANNWDIDAEAELDFLNDDLEEMGPFHGGAEEGYGFDRERLEMEKELMDLKIGIQQGTRNDEEDEARGVDELETMLGKMMAVRGMFSSPQRC